MPVFNPLHDLPALRAQLTQRHENTLVVCYCAQWCDTCKQYQGEFEALADQFPGHTFLWVDIEENPELLGDDDVENFPTLLVQTATANLFYGPMLPYISHLEKLLRHLDETSPALDGGPPLLRALLEA
jgi:thiol-disulfide isomerase/thioredoxin